jgi:hypothetical protein
MPDLDQIKQGEQGLRDRNGRFARGRSGNPAGQPRAAAATTSTVRPDADGFRDEAGQDLAIGWIGAVRPSRRPLSRPPQDEEYS